MKKKTKRYKRKKSIQKAKMVSERYSQLLKKEIRKINKKKKKKFRSCFICELL